MTKTSDTRRRGQLGLQVYQGMAFVSRPRSLIDSKPRKAEGQVVQSISSQRWPGNRTVSFLVSFMFVYLRPSPSTTGLIGGGGRVPHLAEVVTEGQDRAPLGWTGPSAGHRAPVSSAPVSSAPARSGGAYIEDRSSTLVQPERIWTMALRAVNAVGYWMGQNRHRVSGDDGVEPVALLSLRRDGPGLGRSCRRAPPPRTCKPLVNLRPVDPPGSHAGSHTDEPPSDDPNPPGQRREASPRSRTDLNDPGCRYGHLRI